MPADTRSFNLVPHDWHSSDYVSEWIRRDITRDHERRPLLQEMLSFAPFPRQAALEVLDVGAGYGVVSEEVLEAFPAARVTLQDYSKPMLDRARQRLADHFDRLRYVLCDLTDPAWPQQVGSPSTW
jgi:trans-aconitate methyltransferase